MCRLVCDQELIGSGAIIGVGPVSPNMVMDQSLEVEIPLAPRSLGYVDEQLRGDHLDFTLQLHGRFCVHNGQTPEGGAPQFPGAGWDSVELRPDSTTDLRFQVARSDWFSLVLQPLRAEQYMPVEIRIPASLHELHTEFSRATVHIQEAERAYAMGDDPATFSRCRAAIDALPGAKKNIYDKFADPLKRERVNELARILGEYLHSGRHIAQSGSEEGDFPVDHRDAAYALSATKLLVSYTSRLLD